MTTVNLKTLWGPAAAVVYLLAGCVSAGSTIELQESHLSRSVDINLITEDPDWKDSYIFGTVWGKKDYKLNTRPIWTQVFAGTDDSAATFTLREAIMEFHPGYSGTWTYEVDGELECYGRSFPINVQTSRSAAWALDRALRESVEQAVLETAQSAQAFLETCAASSASDAVGDSGLREHSDIYNQLMELDELLRKGVITDDEFAAQKKIVLDNR